MTETIQQYQFSQTLDCKGTWADKGIYTLINSDQATNDNITDYEAFYEREVGFGFKHAINIATVNLKTNPKRLIRVTILSSFASLKLNSETRWLNCSEHFYLNIEDAMGSLIGKTKVYPPKRKPEIIRELTPKQVHEYWNLPYTEESE
ncbi:MAG: hypothetical protein WC365_08975 [Candidatus Babeliales bacterium]|jgi:hypothetical protein